LKIENTMNSRTTTSV